MQVFADGAHGAVITLPTAAHVYMVQEDVSLAGPGLPSFERGVYEWTVWAYAENGQVLAHSSRNLFSIP